MNRTSFIVGLLAASGAARAANLVGVGYNDRNLVSIDKSTAAVSLIGFTGQSVMGLTTEPNGLWAYTQAGLNNTELVRLNPLTGAALQTVSLGSSTGNPGEGGLASDGNGLFWLAGGFSGNNTALYAYNMLTNTIQTINASMGLPIDGLEFDPGSGKLYGLNQAGTGGQYTLYTISTATGAATTIGNLGVVGNVGALASIAIDPDTGVMYAALNTRPGSPTLSTLWTVNTLTGAASFVGDLNGVTAVSGIEFVAGGVPEPGTMGLLGGSLMGLVFWRRRVGR